MDQLNNLATGKPITVAVEFDVQSAIYLAAAIFSAVALGIVLGKIIAK